MPAATCFKRLWFQPLRSTLTFRIRIALSLIILSTESECDDMVEESMNLVL
jgi:hypothetical protein